MLSQQDIGRLLEYDPELGNLFWKERSEQDFVDGPRNSAKQKASSWNSKNAGKEAFTAVNTSGYRHGSINGTTVLAHRVIWILIAGEAPSFIDHIDGNRTNNRWSNLRSVSKPENCQNLRLSPRNSSGVTGVSWYKRLGKWSAKICVDHVDIHLGYFDTIEAAASSRAAAQQKYGFHSNHGKP